MKSWLPWPEPHSGAFSVALFSQFADIGDVARAASGQLVPNERFAIEDGHVDGSDSHDKPPLPRVVELYSRNRREQVDAAGWQADLEDEIRPGKFGLRDLVERRSESSQRGPDARCVVRSRPDPDVEVSCRAHQTVHAKGVRADYEKVSTRVGQRGQHLGEVVVHTPRDL